MAVQDDIKEATVGGTTGYDYDRPANPDGSPYTAPLLNLWGAAQRILFELTLWTGRKTGEQLRAEPDNKLETTHGHARDAASWARDNNLQGQDIQAKLDRIENKQDEILRLLKGGK